MIRKMPYGISVTRTSPTTIDVSDSEGSLMTLNDFTLLEAQEIVCVAAEKHEVLRGLKVINTVEHDRSILTSLLKFAEIVHVKG